jgi:hypothetical protein
MAKNLRKWPTQKIGVFSSSSSMFFNNLWKMVDLDGL